MIIYFNGSVLGGKLNFWCFQSTKSFEGDEMKLKEVMK